MNKVLIFAGTTEGRELAEFCANHHIHAIICIATEYGRLFLPDAEYLKIFPGAMNDSEMYAFMKHIQPKLVIDATHPYAVEATQNIRNASSMANMPYFRLIRRKLPVTGDTAESVQEIIKYLNQNDDTILNTLGSKSLPELTAVRNYQERIWIRVLPVEKILNYCHELGYQHIIAENPPFTMEQNVQHIQKSQAKILLTKESGIAGGYPEKIKAAEFCQIKTLTLVRPVESGLNLLEIENILLQEMS